MPGAFEARPSRDWMSIADELRDVLTVEEFASARASTPNAHYTSPEVIQAIWDVMERLGFQAGGHILEPSMGVGHFFGLMPESLYPGTRRTGVELDSVTFRIAAKLYPDSNVHGRALEDTALPKNFSTQLLATFRSANGEASIMRRKVLGSRWGSDTHDYCHAVTEDL
jgi:hypothetical protein